MPAPTRRRTVMGRYDASAASYDGLYREEQGQKARRLAAMGFRPGRCVVEVGCGSGVALRALQARADISVGADISIQMLRRIRGGRIEPVLCDATRPPLRDGCADSLLLVTSFHHFPYKRRAARRAWRILRPRGLAGLSLLKAAGDSLGVFVAATGARRLALEEGRKDVYALLQKRGVRKPAPAPFPAALSSISSRLPAPNCRAAGAGRRIRGT